jgi:hypothetical protein
MSVFIPVHDAWPYLEGWARAIVLQTLPAERYEAMFVDGGPSDAGARLLAYLLAEVVSSYAEHTCYTHVRRDDGANISGRAVDWPGYFGNLAEAVELVERHSESGAPRDRILRRWVQTEMVARLSWRRFLALGGAEAQSLVASSHQVARARFSTGVVELLDRHAYGRATR